MNNKNKMTDKNTNITEIANKDLSLRTTEGSELYSLLASINSPDEIRALLEDLCTYKELEYFHQRINSAIMLLEGATYQQVSESIDNISTATLSRVSRCIKHGSGGYSKVLKEFISDKNGDNNEK